MTGASRHGLYAGHFEGRPKAWFFVHAADPDEAARIAGAEGPIWRPSLVRITEPALLRFRFRVRDGKQRNLQASPSEESEHAVNFLDGLLSEGILRALDQEEPDESGGFTGVSRHVRARGRR